ncbi:MULTISPECIES: photosystem II protein Y [unclassified Synechococcus]|nr:MULTISPECIES: photosystem II protein Y [unclassified Synechococcus]
MDLRILFVALPILLALSWAAFNIGRAATSQLQVAIKQYKINQTS